MKNNTQTNGAAASFAAEDIINPIALATKLQAGDHPFGTFLLGKLSQTGRGRLATLSGPNADPDALAATLAGELSAIVASGHSLHDPVLVNGAKLRKSTNKLLRLNPQGPQLERFNTLLLQDLFPDELDHDSCKRVDVVMKKGVEFRIYKERRKLKTKWNESFKITFPATEGKTSTHAPTLAQARTEINPLADRVLAGQSPVSKRENKERDAKAAAYDDIADQAAKIGKTDSQSIVEFVTDALKSQLKIGADRPLLDFVTNAVEVMVKPVVRRLLQDAFKPFADFVLGRKDIDKRGARKFVAEISNFVLSMPKTVHQRLTRSQQAGTPPAPCAPDIFVDEILSNDVQTWLNGMKVGWRCRRDRQDKVRSFLKYCRDALHALPPGLPTAAHVLPRTKPDSDLVPKPAPVLSFCDVWRILINLQDLESVWFFALAVFAGLHQSEILRLEWEADIVWESKQIFIASGKGKDKHGNRMGAFVNILHPLDMILGLGRGRTGKIVSRKQIRQDKITAIAHALNVAWVESIMRHSFISYLLGLGYSFDQVSRQARNTVAVLKRHYYAPIPKLEAQRFFSLPIPFELIAQLPIHRRFWDWKSIKKFEMRPDGTGLVVAVPQPPEAPRAKRVLKKRQARIVWPDDLELQVMLWEKSRKQIAIELNCRATTVSERAIKRGLLRPKPGHFERLKHGGSVEIPEAILKAREALAARKKGAASGGDSSATPTPSGSSEDSTQKSAGLPENSHPDTTNHQPEN